MPKRRLPMTCSAVGGQLACLPRATLVVARPVGGAIADDVDDIRSEVVGLALQVTGGYPVLAWEDRLLVVHEVVAVVDVREVLVHHAQAAWVQRFNDPLSRPFHFHST